MFLVHGVLLGEEERDLEHVLAVERHPSRAVRLLERAARRQRSAPVEDADVVEAEEPPREDVAARGVLAVHPPVEVQEEALEGPLEELDVAPAEIALDVVEEERRPRVDGRIHVAEVPLVGGDLPVRVRVQALEHEEELLLGEVEVDERERERVEREVPRRVPGVLPLVGHRDDVAVEHVEPLGVPRGGLLAEERMRVVLGEPTVDVEEIELLGPEHARERLAVDAPFVLGERAGGDLPRRSRRRRRAARRRSRRIPRRTPGSAARPRGAAARPRCRPPARRGRTGPRPSCRSCRGSRRPSRPDDVADGRRPSRTASGWADPRVARRSSRSP